MSYELFQQGPSVYIPVLLFSLIITVLAYGAFPFIFAKTRKATITEKKYKRLCYGINAAVMFVFLVLNGGVSNGAPYLLWTWIFSRYGIKILSARGIILDGEYLPDDPHRLTECKSCGYRDKNFFNACPKCGQYAKQYVYLNEEIPTETDKVRFCRKCGEKLIDSSKFCRKCGTEIVEEPAIAIVELENIEFCKKCGADITNDTDTCHVCGEQKGID